MAAVIFNLVDSECPPNQYAIEQGSTFNTLTIYHPEDLSLWIPKGQIRKTYYYLAPEESPLANFAFLPLVFEPVEVNGETQDRTIIRPYLTDEQTSALPIPKGFNEEGKNRVGQDVWVYDIQLISTTGEVLSLIRGFVDVVPQVTLNA